MIVVVVQRYIIWCSFDQLLTWLIYTNPTTLLLRCPRQYNCCVPRSGVHIHAFAECIEITLNTSSSMYNSRIDFKHEMSGADVTLAPSTDCQIQLTLGFVYNQFHLQNNQYWIEFFFVCSMTTTVETLHSLSVTKCTVKQ